MATKKKATPSKAASNPETDKKQVQFAFSANIEVDGKEQDVKFAFRRAQFKLNKKLVVVADLFDENGAAKAESAEILSHLIEINSGIIQKID